MDLALDQNGDLDVSTGDIQLTTADAALAQRLLIRLRLFAGEWFLNTGIGMPYFERILGKSNLPAVKALFRDAILDTPGVAELLALDLAFTGATRSLTVSFEVRDQTGEVVTFPEVKLP